MTPGFYFDPPANWFNVLCELGAIGSKRGSKFRKAFQRVLAQYRKGKRTAEPPISNGLFGSGYSYRSSTDDFFVMDAAGFAPLRELFAKVGKQLSLTPKQVRALMEEMGLSHLPPPRPPTVEELERRGRKAVLALLAEDEHDATNYRSVIRACEAFREIEIDERIEDAAGTAEIRGRLDEVLQARQRHRLKASAGGRSSADRRKATATDVEYSIALEAKQRMETARKNNTVLDSRTLVADISKWGFTLYSKTSGKPIPKAGGTQKLYRGDDTVRAALRKAGLIARRSQKAERS